MNNSLTAVHQRKSTKKKTKPKAKAVKVVYISNPMKIKTCPSRFRALVQELTGQDAEFPADPTNYYFTTSADGNIDACDLMVEAADHTRMDSDERLPIVAPGSSNITDEIDEDEREVVVLPEVPTVGQTVTAAAAAPHVPYQPLDDEIFTAQMMDNFSGLFQSSLYYNESAASQVDVLRMLNDAM